jgi:gliding motility-associated-like protein
MRSFILFLFLFSTTLFYSQSPTCQGASAICSGGVAPFPNTTGVPSFGGPGCLGSTPNPAWFFFQIGQSGNLEFLLTQGNNAPNYNNQDVDFIVWGPFSSPNCVDLFDYNPEATVYNIIDCSYSPDPTEQIVVPNAITGQYYMLLVTNFSNNSGFIQMSQTNLNQPGAGTTNCNIVCGVNLGPDRLICDSATTSVTLVATYNQAPTLPGTPTYYWYLEGVLQTTTTTNSLVVSQNGTWSVEVTRPGCSDLATDEIEVNIISSIPFNPIPAIQGPSGDCSPCFNLTSYNTAIVSPQDPLLFDFVYYNENAEPILDPTNFCVSADTFVYVEVSSGPCENADFIDINLNCTPSACSLVLTSPISTSNQTICLNDAITNIIYTPGGDATGASVSGLPNGLSAVFNSGELTISGIPSELGTFSYTVTTEGSGCTTPITLTGTITINNIPSFTSLSTNSPICENETAIFTFEGSPNATISYSLNGNPTQTIVLDGTGNGLLQVSNASVDLSILLLDIAIGSCDEALTDSATIVVNPNPIFISLSNNGPVCVGTDAEFILNGTPNAVVSYSINGNTSQTITFDSFGFATIVEINPSSNVDLTLSAISSGNCVLNLSNSSTIIVAPTPELISISSNSSICQGDNAIFYITGSPNATVNYNINGGLIQSVVLDATGNATVTSTGPVADVTISLLDILIGSCNTTLGANTSVTVDLPPVIDSLNSLNSTICSGSMAEFLISGTPNAVVTYSINGLNNQTFNLDGSGNYTLSFVSSSVDVELSLISISLGNCTSSLINSEIVTVVSVPTPTIDIIQEPTCINPTGIIEVLSPLGLVGGIASDLFISEITDEDIGALTYIEIFNGTGVAKNLAGYKIKVYNNGNSFTSCEIPLSGTLNPNATFVVSIGTVVNQGGVIPDLVAASCAGINTNDNIRLTTSTDVEVDLWGRTDGIDFTPSNADGYTYRRLPNAIVPSLSWNPIDWIAIDPQDYTNVGTYDFFVNGYEYILDNGTSQVIQNATIFSGILPGDYSLIVHDLVSDCYSLPYLFTIAPPIYTNPEVEFNYSTPICILNSETILPNLENGFNLGGSFTSTNGLSLDSNSGQIDLSNSIPGLYTVTYTFAEDIANCLNGGFYSFEIEISAALTPTFENYEVCLNRNAVLPSASIEGYTGVWSPLNIDTSQSGEYNFIFTSDNSCALSGSLTIVVNACEIPKGVSPNGDGLNDTWDLSGLNALKVQIYNRYGVEVYSKKNYVNEWTGTTSSGGELPTGTYYYLITTSDNSITGWVYINRQE